jgi:hypothetical protein
MEKPHYNDEAEIDPKNRNLVQTPNQYEQMKDTIPLHKLAKFLESDEGEPFFLGENDEIGCMDGRVKPEGALGLAGSGILLPRDEGAELPKQKYLDILAKRAKDGKLKAITWHCGEEGKGHGDHGHGGCGAAKLYMKGEGLTPTEDSANKTAESFVKKLAAKISEMSGVKIEAKEAPGEGDHSEVGAVLDWTDSLDLISQDGDTRVQLPNVFMHNPRLTNDPAYVLIEIKVAITIALSKHGKNGEKQDFFTKENPFMIKWVESAKKPLTNEEEKIWKDFPEMVREMVKKEFPNDVEKISVLDAKEYIKVPH